MLKFLNFEELCGHMLANFICNFLLYPAELFQSHRAMDPLTQANIGEIITASKISARWYPVPARFAGTEIKQIYGYIYPRQLRNNLFISGIVAKCQHDIAVLPRASSACLHRWNIVFRSISNLCIHALSGWFPAVGWRKYQTQHALWVYSASDGTIAISAPLRVHQRRKTKFGVFYGMKFNMASFASCTLKSTLSSDANVQNKEPLCCVPKCQRSINNCIFSAGVYVSRRKPLRSF